MSDSKTVSCIHSSAGACEKRETKKHERKREKKEIIREKKRRKKKESKKKKDVMWAKKTLQNNTNTAKQTKVQLNMNNKISEKVEERKPGYIIKIIYTTINKKVSILIPHRMQIIIDPKLKENT